MKDILKGILVVLVVIGLLAVSQARAQTLPQLDGAELVEYGNCMYNTHLVDCAVYQKDGVKYLFYRDDNGIFSVYRINADATKPYGPRDTVLIWERKKPGLEV